MPILRILSLAAMIFATMILESCRQDPAAALPHSGAIVRGNRQSELQPGVASPARIVKNPFEGDEAALADGKRLYNQFNCSGCHAAGGGAIGPPLMDDEWIYGSSGANIFWTIIEGRPQGMPAFGGRIVDDQAWRIVAYVRSLSGFPKEEPGQTGQPGATEGK